MAKAAKAPSDDTLFGLLSTYKFNNTYLRVMISEEENRIAVQVTDNPSKWHIPSEEEEKDPFTSYRLLRRLEIGCHKLSIKYLNKNQLIMIKGPLLGIRIPQKQTEIFPAEENRGIHTFAASREHEEKILRGVRNILSLSPQAKYEIIEKSINLCLEEGEPL